MLNLTLMVKLTTEEMLNKFSKSSSHPKEVCSIAMKLFDEINNKIFPMTDQEKEYLKAGALLHDIGYYIEEKSHNKHSLKLILDYGLKNFDEKETKIIGCICRYHRGSLPDKINHDIYNTLEKKERKIVKRLGGIVKLADGLDTEHREIIKDIKINFDEKYNIAEIILIPKFDKINISSAVRKRDLFEIGFKCQSIIKSKA